MRIFSDERLPALGIISGTVSRHGGNMRDIANVKTFFEKLDIDPSKILGLKQVHGAGIIKMLTPSDLAAYRAVQTHEADAWLLGLNNTGVMVLTADCAPLFVWDDAGKYIGLAHCGWRGVVENLPAKIAAAVKEQAGAGAKLYAYLGPHINKCCFEVKEDVAARFSQQAVIRREGKIFIDLSTEIKKQLKEQGIAEADIKSGCACQCTMCDKENFFSYRRDHTKDALLSFVYKI